MQQHPEAGGKAALLSGCRRRGGCCCCQKSGTQGRPPARIRRRKNVVAEAASDVPSCHSESFLDVLNRRRCAGLHTARESSHHNAYTFRLTTGWNSSFISCGAEEEATKATAAPALASAAAAGGSCAGGGGSRWHTQCPRHDVPAWRLGRRRSDQLCIPTPKAPPVAGPGAEQWKGTWHAARGVPKPLSEASSL